jgi:hypothetical protein
MRRQHSLERRGGITVIQLHRYHDQVKIPRAGSNLVVVLDNSDRVFRLEFSWRVHKCSDVHVVLPFFYEWLASHNVHSCAFDCLLYYFLRFNRFVNKIMVVRANNQAPTNMDWSIIQVNRDRFEVTLSVELDLRKTHIFIYNENAAEHSADATEGLRVL